jgi:hypothetical protein
LLRSVVARSKDVRKALTIGNGRLRRRRRTLIEFEIEKAFLRLLLRLALSRRPDGKKEKEDIAKTMRECIFRPGITAGASFSLLMV